MTVMFIYDDGQSRITCYEGMIISVAKSRITSGRLCNQIHVTCVDLSPMFCWSYLSTHNGTIDCRRLWNAVVVVTWYFAYLSLFYDLLTLLRAWLTYALRANPYSGEAP